jgi:hypothetical protein
VSAVRTLPRGLPTHTLGWSVLEWCTRYVRQPDGPHAGEPWEFTPEQVRFVLWWYAIDGDGRWLWTRGVLRRPKGWGKSPFVAALCLVELCGPCRFDGWEDNGDPVAAPVNGAWVQIAGVSEKQTANTYTMVTAMVRESPIVEDYGLDVGLTRIFTKAGGRLEPITASAETAEGARPTFVVEDETHHWTESNGGAKLDRTNRRNVAKIPGGTGRVLETTNAHASGEGSVAEASYDAYLAMASGQTRHSRLLYDSLEAGDDVDLADEPELMAGLREAYGDSWWVDRERLRDEIWDPATPAEDSRRFYLNQIAAASDAWLADWEWNGCYLPDRIVGRREPVVLGFDGSRRRSRHVTDATSIVGCTVSDGYLFEVATWEQPHNVKNWEVPVAQVLVTMRETFKRLYVVGLFADPAKWETHVSNWEAEYGPKLKVKATAQHPCQWWMTGQRNRQTVRALEQIHDAIIDRELHHDGSGTLTRHFLNARNRPSTVGNQIGKEHPDSPKKIDAAVAGTLAWQARLAALAAGVGQKSDTYVPRRVR